MSAPVAEMATAIRDDSRVDVVTGKAHAEVQAVVGRPLTAAELDHLRSLAVIWVLVLDEGVSLAAVLPAVGMLLPPVERRRYLEKLIAERAARRARR